MNLIEEQRADETMRGDPGVRPFNDEFPHCTLRLSHSGTAE